MYFEIRKSKNRLVVSFNLPEIADFLSSSRRSRQSQSGIPDCVFVPSHSHWGRGLVWSLQHLRVYSVAKNNSCPPAFGVKWTMDGFFFAVAPPSPRLFSFFFTCKDLAAWFHDFIALKYRASFETKFAKVGHTVTKLCNILTCMSAWKLLNFLDSCTNPTENVVFSPKIHKKLHYSFLKSLKIIYFVLIIFRHKSDINSIKNKEIHKL